MKLIKPAFMDKKEEEKEYFLSLILRNEKATAVVFEKTGNQVKFVGKGERNFTDTIEKADSEEFLDALDKAIGEAESVLPPNVETHKTLFALKASWVEDNKIKKERLDLLKKADSELSLNPIGFLVFAESVVNLVQKDEGAPVSAILAEVGEKYLTAYLVKGGRVIEARTSEIHESTAHSLDLVLKHFQATEVMPARILILADTEEDLTQEFIGFSWSKSIPFLHIPQIQSLPEESDVKAVLLGAAVQMNANLIFDAQSVENNQAPGENVEEEEKSDETQEVQKESDAKELFGFVEGADVIKSQPKNPMEHSKEQAEILEEVSPEIPEEIKESYEQPENMGSVGVSMVDKLKVTAAAVFASFRKFNFKKIPIGNFGQRNILIIPIILTVLVIAFLFILSLNAKAKVEIFVNPKDEQKNASVTFSPNGSTNLDENTLKVNLVSVNESGQTTINTSGKQDVGEKAKGTVTIFNNDTDSISLSSGTTITASSGQKFTLDSAVKVASASGDIFSGTKPGTTDVKVTAAGIGPEYNLPSGTKFTVGSSTTAAGKNDSAFSGGTKKSVTVVSKDDISKAEQELPKSLSEKAKGDLSQKVEDGFTLLPDFVNTDLSSEDFSNKLNDQSDSLTLKANVSFNFISYKNSEMQDLVSRILNDPNFSLDKSDLNISAKNLKVLKNKDISATLNIDAKLLPKIDNDLLSKQIAGESILKARNQITNINQVADTTITISPHIPFLSNTLPKNPKNIQIVITSR